MGKRRKGLKAKRRLAQAKSVLARKHSGVPYNASFSGANTFLIEDPEAILCKKPKKEAVLGFAPQSSLSPSFVSVATQTDPLTL